MKLYDVNMIFIFIILVKKIVANVEVWTISILHEDLLLVWGMSEETLLQCVRVTVSLHLTDGHFSFLLFIFLFSFLSTSSANKTLSFLSVAEPGTAGRSPSCACCGCNCNVISRRAASALVRTSFTAIRRFLCTCSNEQSVVAGSSDVFTCLLCCTL